METEITTCNSQYSYFDLRSNFIYQPSILENGAGLIVRHRKSQNIWTHTLTLDIYKTKEWEIISDDMYALRQLLLIFSSTLDLAST